MMGALITRWIDGLWREPGNQIKVTLLPAIVPFILLGAVDIRAKEVWIVAALVSASWVGFVMWRAWCVMREMSRNG